VQKSRDYIENGLKERNKTGIVLCRYRPGGLTEENSGNEDREFIGVGSIFEKFLGSVKAKN
jgi:hypothetical protein